MYENVRISNVSGGESAYDVRASSGGVRAERDIEFNADQVYLNGVLVKTGTAIGLPSGEFEIEENGDRIEIESE